jgi:universal stress protein E
MSGQRILVAVKDPDDMADPALLKAAQLARSLHATLEIFHAISPWRHHDDRPLSRARLRKLKRDAGAVVQLKLRKVAASLRRRHIDASAVAEWDYPPYEAIIRRAQHIKADLIVAGQNSGTHALAGLLKLTDWELLRLAPMPVLLSKTSRLYRHPVVVAAVDPAHANDKPGNLDERILTVSSMVSRALRGTLHAVHAYVPFPLDEAPHLPLSPATFERRTAELATAARQRFERLLRTTRIRKANRHLSDRHPIDAIELAASTLHSSIVVMGAISRTRLRRLLLGNTAEAVLDDLDCDVLIVKPAHFVSGVPRRRNPR